MPVWRPVRLIAGEFWSLKDGKPAVEGSPEELARKGTECLACEYECWFRGNAAITIEVPIEGLADYRKKYGTQ